ncbi:sensor histidine kinase [Paenibacillus chartarius]|uniref:histidine kinase n=1 Tax=Paenibacillus chartarius TaxID=747481 RepID=A0ABV6DVQ7_9BACL
MTLKRRIIILFLVSSFVPFAGIIAISYVTIYSIVTNKLQSGMQSNLRQVELSLQNTITNLNHVSQQLVPQQLAFEGSAGQKLGQILSAEHPFERLKLTEELGNEISTITFTNPSIGLTMYVFKDDNSYRFENLAVKDGFTLDTLPLLVQYYGISYYGPHISNNRFDNQYVLSAVRKVPLPQREDVYVYIETGFKLTQAILDNDQFGGAVSHLFLDNDGKIVYSERGDAFPRGAPFPAGLSAEESGEAHGYVWFKERSNQGWSIVSLIPAADYRRELNRWFVQIALFAFVLLAVSLLLAWLLWRMVYKPLNKFNKEIKLMTQSRTLPQTPDETKSAATHIPEFDVLLHQFRQMKEQIWTLFSEIELKEKRRVDLEVEKLLYQINPHFLMNSLDTVHWLAVMNGQTEIDRLVLSLNKLLYYNLGKLGQTATIEEELDALRQYLTLQQIRYDFEFDVRIHVDERVLKAPVPRFILQPIVENSLYHGLDDNGYIEVNVRGDGDRIDITIGDNGSGMSKETIRELLEQQGGDQRKVGMGIGMSYVRRMLETQYGTQAELHIDSVIGQGTQVLLRLPIQEAEAI